MKVLRLVPFLSLGMLAACTQQDADAAARGFFNWMMVLILVGILAFVLWALVLAGGIAALIAGYRRLTRNDEPPLPSSPPQSGETPPPPAPDAAPPPGAAGNAPPLPATRRPDQRRPGPDSVAIVLIVFGVLLVLGAGPFVLFGDRDSSGLFSVQIPLPMLIIAGVLVWLGVKRRGNG